MAFGNRGFNRGGNNRGFSSGGRGGFNDRPREMHKIKCSKCGQDAEVPFEPKQGRPVYCRDCFQQVRDNPELAVEEKPAKKEVAEKKPAKKTEEETEEAEDSDE